MSKNLNFTERMALALAARFGDFGFDDIKDVEVRTYLEHALALLNEKKPLDKWQTERIEMCREELEKQRKALRRDSSNASIKEALENLERYVVDFQMFNTAKLEAGKRARELEPNLASQFALNAAERQIAALKRYSTGAKKRKTSEEKK